MKLYFAYKLMLRKVITYTWKRDFWILLRMCSFFLFFLELKTVLIIKCIFICFYFLLQDSLALTCASVLFNRTLQGLHLSRILIAQYKFIDFKIWSKDIEVIE